MIYQGTRGQGRPPLKSTQPERRRGRKSSSASQASQQSTPCTGAFCPCHKGTVV